MEQTVERVRALDAGGVVNLFCFGGMPHEVAQRSLDTYVDQVLPKLRATDPHRDLGVPTGAR
ncbi:hypothetical protein [Pseudonocardia sp. NPDC049154]|uniref:hypothetical protein n=1 Tax=Pseudonocardia sp. NPDC049154 TaxID=3155501 RepID=UPI0033E00800